MRAFLLTLAASLALLGSVDAAALAAGPPGSSAQHTLVRTLNAGMRAAGAYSGADVVDLSTGQTLFSKRARLRRLPASVEKLFTTSTALLSFGPTGTLTTSLLAVGAQQGGTFTGTLYLRGGGDPTFGAASFDSSFYGAGTGATMQQLVENLLGATGMRALDGNVVADESMFDSLRGTPATGFQPSTDVEGELSALSYDRGWTSSNGTTYYQHPAVQAGLELVSALKAAGVAMPAATPVSAGPTPANAVPLAQVQSPPIATLISLTNTPSDNYFAEMLVKAVGAHFGTGGTTADGAAAVRAQLAQSFGIHPRLNDGSGLSRYDRTTPLDVVTLLKGMAANAPFTNSLAVAGRTGTLQQEMRGTYAQGRCRGKTGTLHDVSNVAGYCRARDGHTLAFAFLMNGIYPYYAHPIQNQMMVALARYGG